ncbi:hypothetical protein DFS34DRAFT_612733 [Phlyctochytrium arcticum]|nr:hypothetical protein DFS34DRAFT_612733 [Phlyctochytrium arcticum]
MLLAAPFSPQPAPHQHSPSRRLRRQQPPARPHSQSSHASEETIPIATLKDHLSLVENTLQNQTTEITTQPVWPQSVSGASTVSMNSPVLLSAAVKWGPPANTGSDVRKEDHASSDGLGSSPVRGEGGSSAAAELTNHTLRSSPRRAPVGRKTTSAENTTTTRLTTKTRQTTAMGTSSASVQSAASSFSLSTANVTQNGKSLGNGSEPRVATRASKRKHQDPVPSASAHSLAPITKRPKRCLPSKTAPKAKAGKPPPSASNITRETILNKEIRAHSNNVRDLAKWSLWMRSMQTYLPELENKRAALLQIEQEYLATRILPSIPFSHNPATSSSPTPAPSSSNCRPPYPENNRHSPSATTEQLASTSFQSHVSPDPLSACITHQLHPNLPSSMPARASSSSQSMAALLSDLARLTECANTVHDRIQHRVLEPLTKLLENERHRGMEPLDCGGGMA